MQVLGKVIKFVQYNKDPIDYYKLNSKTLEPNSLNRIYDK